MIALDATCHHCGSQPGPEVPIESGGLTLYPRRRRAAWQSNEARLQPAQISILATLIGAAGSLVSPRTLLSRAGYRGDNHAANLKVHLCRIRKALPGLPIYNDAGIGYAWRPDTKGPSA